MSRLDMGLPPPPMARYPSQMQQPIDYNAWGAGGADYGGGLPMDYPIGGFDSDEPLTPPPKKVRLFRVIL